MMNEGEVAKTWLKEDAPGPASESQFDKPLLVITILLVGFGLLMVYSAGSLVSARKFDGPSSYFLIRQLGFSVVGFFLLWQIAHCQRRTIHNLVIPTYLFSVFLLVLVPIIGVERNNSTRWLFFMGLTFQPLELVKIGVVLLAARCLGRHQEYMHFVGRSFIPVFLLISFPMILLASQPDFGGSLCILSAVVLLMFVGRVPIRYLVYCVMILIPILLSYLFSKTYRLQRVITFFSGDPFSASQDSGYQIVRALMAFGAGGLSGVGIGSSDLKSRLPEAQNDYIMAVVGEEFGFIGVVAVVSAFSFLFYRCYLIIQGQRNPEDRLAAFGLTFMLFWGAALNLAVALNAVPSKGVPMPFVSYGGSSLLCSLICIGLLLNYSRTSVR
ncbi:MAG: putative peptidoglycan glycosyltransferase FtsW [Desulfovibrionaceae bacterium]|nr:putative peptidoglycan glycosyltransferase FtsW [Desulfovibrionaceae bacterium]